MMSRSQELVTTITCDMCGKAKITVTSKAAYAYSGWLDTGHSDICPWCKQKDQPNTQRGDV